MQKWLQKLKEIVNKAYKSTKISPAALSSKKQEKKSIGKRYSGKKIAAEGGEKIWGY